MNSVLSYIKKRIILYKKLKRSNSKIKSLIGLLGPEYITFGKNVIILKNARIECYNSYYDQKIDPLLIIGENCYIGHNFTALVADKLSIGDNCLLASNILITTLNHGDNPNCSEPYMRQPISTASVAIGNNCWVGERVMILPGVTIGKNCILGAGTIVTEDIPDDCIAVGCPAKVIKKYNYNINRWEKYNEIS